MRTLIRRPAEAPGDYAPSRLAYRMERLMLTPLIRKLIRLGLPVFVLTMIVGALIADESRRNTISLAVAEVRTQLANRPEFLVHGMKIEGASAELAEAVRAALPLDFPVSSFDLDLDAMQDTVATLDPVAEVHLQIGAQGILRMRVVERVPVAIWRSAEGLMLCDATGHVVARLAARADRPDLPLIAGEGARDALPEAMEVLAAAAPLTGRLRGLARIGARRWDLVLDRGQTIQLPEIAPVAALAQVLALDQAQDLLERDMTVIDMRTPRRPTLRLTQAAQDQLQNIRLLQAGGSSE